MTVASLEMSDEPKKSKPLYFLTFIPTRLSAAKLSIYLCISTYLGKVLNKTLVYVVIMRDIIYNGLATNSTL